MLTLVLYYLWNLRHERWYWLTVVTIAILHVPLIWLVRWPNQNFNYIELTPFALLDFGAYYGSVRLVEKLVTARE
jgi:hypothetical protein